MEQITGKRVPLVVADIMDTPALDAVFAAHKFDAVVHFAALKGPSVVCLYLLFNNVAPCRACSRG